MSLQTSVPIEESKKEYLAKDLSRIIVEATGKPEAYVMVTISSATVVMAGAGEPAAFADVRSIGGLSIEVNGAISSKVCSLLEKELGIQGNRVYLNFTDMERQNWGFDSRTFG